MSKHCERPPTNAEIFYKVFHEWLGFWWKLVQLIFKSKLQSTLFVVALCSALMFISANLTLADCIEGAKYILTIL